MRAASFTNGVHVSVLLVVLFGGSAVAQQHASSFSSQTVLEELALKGFEDCINEYVNLLRPLEAAFPALTISEARWAVDELAAVIRTSRPYASVGDIFTPEVTGMFRGRILTVLRSHNHDIGEIHRSSLDQLTEWTQWADKVLVW
jgi:hypothetical protein